MMINQILIDIIGWVGAALILLAYFQISKGQVQGNSAYYQWLNVVGSAFLIINTLYYGALPSTAVNVVWISIAIYMLIKISRDSNG